MHLFADEHDCVDLHTLPAQPHLNEPSSWPATRAASIAMMKQENNIVDLSFRFVA